METMVGLVQINVGLRGRGLFGEDRLRVGLMEIKIGLEQIEFGVVDLMACLIEIKTSMVKLGLVDVKGRIAGRCEVISVNVKVGLVRTRVLLVENNTSPVEGLLSCHLWKCLNS